MDTQKTYRILSIDAWAGQEEGTWDWNSWHKVGEYTGNLDDDNAILEFFIREGFLKPEAKTKVYLNDDGHNIVLTADSNHEPLYAIEHGNKF